MRNFFGKCWQGVKRVAGKVVASIIGAGAGLLTWAGVSHAEFTLPTLPVTDLESAGTAVAAFIAVAVVIGAIFRLLRKV